MNTSSRVDIAVVGGGTAGWLTALALAHCFGRGGASLMVIESPDLPSIGVGESTLPTLGRTLLSLDLDEEQWMKEVGATYKLGVRFRDWCHPGSLISRADFWNPVEPVRDAAAVDLWFDTARHRSYPEMCCATPPLLERDLIPINTDGARLSEYAFHVDAIKLAGLLRDQAKARGVQHRIDHVTRARTGPEGISSLELESGINVHASIYVDCTGFRSVLLGGALHEPWISYEDTLLTDRAVAIAAPVGKSSTEPLATYTTAQAMSSGWAWQVPLADRFGSGYVYSSKHQSAEDAEVELRTYLGAQAADVPARHISAMTGRRRRSWAGNCVAIGLASGFVEPLEATGIYFIERAISTFIGCLNAGDGNSYNDVMTRSYEEVRDLIVMHYLVNDRVDSTFWQATKNIEIPASLTARLDEWQHRAPATADFPRSAVFGATTWLSVLSGMGFWREPFDPEPASAITKVVADAQAQLLAASTDHRVLVGALRAR